MGAQDDGRAEAADNAVKFVVYMALFSLATWQGDGASHEGHGFKSFATVCLAAWALFVARGAWVLAAERRGRAAAEERRRLDLALSIEGCGFTREWYDAAGWWIRVARAGGVCALVAVMAAICGVAYPQAGLDWAGDRLQQGWEHALDNYTHRQIFVGGYMLSHFVLYWVMSIANLAADFIRPAALEPFRIFPKHQITAQDAAVAAAVALFNEFLTLLPHWYGVGLYEAWVPNGFGRQLPSLAELVISQVAIMCVSEPFFYFSHRLLHTEWGYKHIHYIHHTVMAPTAVQAIYAHPAEHLFSVTPFFLFGPLLFRAHWSLWCVWYANRTFQSCYAHCSLSVPLIASNMFHSFHHEEVAGPEGYQNYGFNSGILDALFGSTQYYREHTWQARVDKKYNDQTLPVDRALARAGLLPPAGGDDSAAPAVAPAGKAPAPLPPAEAEIHV